MKPILKLKLNLLKDAFIWVIFFDICVSFFLKKTIIKIKIIIGKKIKIIISLLIKKVNITNEIITNDDCIKVKYDLIIVSNLESSAPKTLFNFILFILKIWSGIILNIFSKYLNLNFKLIFFEKYEPYSETINSNKILKKLKSKKILIKIIL